MTLMQVGSKLGPYEIIAPIGAGGMGEVYRARDTKLNRDVALKVLPAEFANDPERMGRFKREAQLLASLNHTNIAAIYGLEDSGGVSALVMELAEGTTLADPIGKGPIPMDEALAIALQIAEALETAHEKGIIHRDLKPANIKITPEGVVKVLDFGLAKAMQSEAAATDMSQSPTLSLAATKAGIILGTAAYMAPEQARGSAVDKRCDIWSFGVVLFEMLIGKQLFAAETVSDTLAAVLRADVDWNLLPVNTPASIRTLLCRCLNKDRRQRLQAIGEARVVIGEHLTNPEAFVPARPAPAGRGAFREWMGWGVAFLCVAGITAMGFIHFRQTTAEPPMYSLEVNTPPTADPGSLAVSPDGRILAFVAVSNGRQVLWVRPLDQTKARPLPDTEGANYPFWSPDNRRIGFFAGGKLKRIDITGGRPQILTDAPYGQGGAWNQDDVIVFAPSFRGPLYRIGASTPGESIAVTKVARPRQIGHVFPKFMPDGRRLLFYARGDDKGIYLVSLESGEARRVFDIGPGEPQTFYVSSGHLLVMRQGALYAEKFDTTDGRVAGNGIPIVDSVAADYSTRAGAFSFSETGVLAYRTGNSSLHRLAWFDRTGRDLGTLGAANENSFLDPEISRDQERLALDRIIQGNRDVWIIDAKRGVPAKLTSDAAIDTYPKWSPDGQWVVFSSNRNKAYFGLYRRSTNGTGKEESLLNPDIDCFPDDWSADGQLILFEQQNNEKSSSDLWVLPMSGNQKPFPFATTPNDEALGQFSPDGRWVAYQSNDSGRYEIYLKPFPGPGDSIPVSTTGGTGPRWRSDGKELFYMDGEGNLKGVPMRVDGQTPGIGTPVKLFHAPILGGDQIMDQQQYAVSRDGRRFLISTIANESNAFPITIVTDWTRLLKK